VEEAMTYEHFTLNRDSLTAALRKLFAVPMFCSECGFASLKDEDFVVHGSVRRCARFFECSGRKDARDLAMRETTLEATT
jgi:hypothetical protein